MKKFIRLLIFVFIIFLNGCTGGVKPPEFLTIGGGYGGRFHTKNTTVEFGSTFQLNSHNRLISFGFMNLSQGSVPMDVNDLVYTSDSVEMKQKEYNSRLGIFGKHGFELYENKGIYVTGLLGCLHEKSNHYSMYNGEYCNKSRESHNYGIIGGGLSYFPKRSNIWLQVDYDNIRGMTGQIGYCWEF